MNRKSISRGAIVTFGAAVVLLIFGMGMILVVFREFENTAFSQDTHRELMEVLHQYAYRLMLGMSQVTAGLAIGLILFLHMLRRTARIQKEAAALEKKNAQMQALNAEIRQLNHHQRLELMGTLTSSIAHEFNNLLTPIMGYSLMALEKLPPEEEELYDNLLVVYNASKEAKTLITRLNDLSRKQSETSFRQVSVDDIIRHAMKVAAPAKPEGVEIQQSLNCWGQRIRGNEIQLSQLVLNLVLNSFHAVSHCGKICVETSYDEKWTYIRVLDNGCGIPQENMHRIYEPFFTTRETGKGTGLGLAIAAQTVEDHNGKISASSKVGEGTTITVQLPRV